MQYLHSEEMPVISILLVDDDAEDLELFTEAISQLSMPIELKILSYGKDLMQFLYSDAPLPDILFLDLHMHMMDGEDCLTGIGQERQFQTIPIVIYSTSFEVSRIEHLFHLGAYFFLQKPLLFNDLVTTLEQFIKLALCNVHGNKVVNRIFNKKT